MLHVELMGHSQTTYKDKLLAFNVLLCKKENAGVVLMGRENEADREGAHHENSTYNPFV